MHLGTVIVRIPKTVRRWTEKFGEVPVQVGIHEEEMEHYRCESCGKDHHVLGKPTERFYCSGCQRLVGVTS
jgi:hypothetical protein